MPLYHALPEVPMAYRTKQGARGAANGSIEPILSESRGVRRLGLDRSRNSS